MLGVANISSLLSPHPSSLPPATFAWAGWLFPVNQVSSAGSVTCSGQLQLPCAAKGQAGGPGGWAGGLQGLWPPLLLFSRLLPSFFPGTLALGHCDLSRCFGQRLPSKPGVNTSLSCHSNRQRPCAWLLLVGGKAAVTSSAAASPPHASCSEISFLCQDGRAPAWCGKRRSSGQAATVLSLARGHSQP